MATFSFHHQEVRAGRVAAAVFKTVVRSGERSAGGFDSHALPFPACKLESARSVQGGYRLADPRPIVA